MTAANPPGALVEEFIIPARHGRAFVVPKGRVMRIYPVEDGQVGDCAFFNANDYKEVFHVGQSWSLNVMMGIGSGRRPKVFFSKPPRENPMLTTIADTYGDHWGNMGGRCSKRIYEVRKAAPDHRSCQGNLEEAVAPFGLTGDDIIDIFNIFMRAELTPDWGFRILPTTVTKNDYMDLRAEMDVLAAISACPADDNATNNGRSAPLGIKIYQP